MSKTHVKRRTGLLHSKQVDQHFDGDLYLSGLTMPAAAAATFDLSTAVTTAANVAGRNGAPVPVQVATDIDTSGFVLTGIVQVSDSNTKPMADSNGNEIYGRLTEAAGVYTLSFYSMVSGVETAYTMTENTAFNAVIGYRYDLHLMPPTATRSPLSVRIAQDPVGAGATREVVAVTAINTLANLAGTPNGLLQLHVNGQVIDVGTSTSKIAPGVSFSGQAISWKSKPVDFNTATAYAIGDQCYEAGVLQTATVAVAAGSAFDPANWTAGGNEDYVGYDLETTDFVVAMYR
jgi:hypothetical protein